MRALPKPSPKPSSSGGWIVTFADLMSLLLTFFILLLSFSEMDAEKYEAMARAMAVSFGVSQFQGDGAGGSVIFAEGPPPSVVDELDLAKQAELDRQAELEKEFEELENEFEEEEISLLEEEKPEEAEFSKVDPNVEQLAEKLVEELQEEIFSEALSVNYEADKVVMRFSSATTFTSGSEELKYEMYDIIKKIEDVLASCGGQIVVSGYTDDRPVNSSRFRSNWDLSAARAVSVVHQLVLNNKIDANSVMAAGHAETNPLVPNDTADNRAKNRRVEISVLNPDCGDTDFEF